MFHEIVTLPHEIVPIGGTVESMKFQLLNKFTHVSDLNIRDFEFFQKERPVHPYMKTENTDSVSGYYKFTFRKGDLPDFVRVLRKGFECESHINPNEP